MLSANAMEKRIQIAGILLITGLLVEAVCLLWALPITFVIFAMVGGLLILMGLVIFLYSLVSTT